MTAARERIAERIVPRAVFEKIQLLMADYRGERQLP